MSVGKTMLLGFVEAKLMQSWLYLHLSFAFRGILIFIRLDNYIFLELEGFKFIT